MLPGSHPLKLPSVEEIRAELDRRRDKVVCLSDRELEELEDTYRAIIGECERRMAAGDTEVDEYRDPVLRPLVRRRDRLERRDRLRKALGIQQGWQLRVQGGATCHPCRGCVDGRCSRGPDPTKVGCVEFWVWECVLRDVHAAPCDCLTVALDREPAVVSVAELDARARALHAERHPKPAPAPRVERSADPAAVEGVAVAPGEARREAEPAPAADGLSVRRVLSPARRRVAPDTVPSPAYERMVARFGAIQGGV